MSTPRPPQPAKLVIGLFMQDKDLFKPVGEELSAKFGPPDMISPWLDFDYTDYYAREMGDSLFRRMLSFRELIGQDHLPDIKWFAYELEKKYMQDGSRRVNIDPGYLLPERFVLATGKNFTHRIYIGREVYADLTLIYTKGNFQTLPWTYPDYADEKMLDFLRQVRNRYIYEMKAKKHDQKHDSICKG
ncbi:MAG: DUF4416 family protein [Desulfococcaceae bacterium]